VRRDHRLGAILRHHYHASPRHPARRRATRGERPTPPGSTASSCGRRVKTAWSEAISMGSTPKRAVSLRSCRSYVPAEGARPATQRRPSSRGATTVACRSAALTANSSYDLTRARIGYALHAVPRMSLCVRGNGPKRRCGSVPGTRGGFVEVFLWPPETRPGTYPRPRAIPRSRYPRTAAGNALLETLFARLLAITRCDRGWSVRPRSSCP
jgi:hypothetical protein